MRASSQQRNYFPGEEFPEGGNMNALSFAAQNASDILEGRLTRDQMEALSTRYGNEPMPDYEKKWLETLDPKPLIAMLENEPDRWNRIQIMRTVEASAKYLIEKYPESLEHFMRTTERVAKQYPEKDSGSLIDPIDTLGYWRVTYWNVDKHPIEEYCAYFDGYAKILPSFLGRCEHYKIEGTLKEAMKWGYWRNMFLWLELLECPKGIGTFEYGVHRESVFTQLDEEEVRYVAGFSPKRSHAASTVITKFTESKRQLEERHPVVWKRIEKVIRDNPLADEIIGNLLYFSSWYSLEWYSPQETTKALEKIEQGLLEMEFMGDFGRRLPEKTDHRMIRWLQSLRKAITDPETLDQVLWILAEQSPKYINYYAESISKYAQRLPSLEKLSQLLDIAERLSNKYQYWEEGHTRVFTDYLIRYAGDPESVETLERFLDAHRTPSCIRMIRILPETFQPQWDAEPLYARALRNEPQHDRQISETSRFADHGSRLFVELCISGLSITECENAYQKIARSRDFYRIMNTLMDGYLEERKDKATLAAVIRFRSKNFRKILQAVSAWSDRYVNKPLSQYIPEHQLWNTLSDKQLEEVAEGGYARSIQEVCAEVGMDSDRYQKDILSFKRTLVAYPEMAKNLDKFEKSERALFDIKIHAAYHKLARHYIEILQLSTLDPLFLERLKRDEIFTLVQMLATSTTNRDVGKKLLLEAIGPEGASEFVRNQAENQEWLGTTLTEDQRNIWLSRYEKTYSVTKTQRRTDQSAINEAVRHLRVATELLATVKYQGKINLSSATAYVESLPRLLEENPDFRPEFASDLQLQSQSITKIFLKSKERSVSQVKIYHEHDPLRVIMMGDWVDKSCLASFSSVGNCWSAIANATESNKAVFYAEDEKGNVIGRVLLAINEKKQLIPFTVYLRGTVDVDLDIIFKKYLADFRKAMKMPFSNDAKSVKRILGCFWYVDPIWQVPGILPKEREE